MGATLKDDGARLVGERAAAGPGWLAAARAAAWELFATGALPDRSLHRWRYTDPARLLPGPRPLTGEARLAAAGAPAGGRAAVVTRAAGQATLQVDPAAVAAGLVVESLAEGAAALEGRLGTIAAADETPFAALNAALWDDGLHVALPAGLALEAPILHAHTFAGTGLALPRAFVSVGRAASAVLVDETLGGDTDGGEPLVHRVVEAELAEGAQLTLVLLQDLPAAAQGTALVRARLARDARLTLVLASFGAARFKTDVACTLAGPGASSEVLGIVFGAGRQEFDHHAIQRHEAPDTSSRLNVRVAVKDRARSAFTGMLGIVEGAVRTDAFQENRNLLLSDAAQAVSIPELEIATDDVRASHGATVGPIDEDQVYYLAARGLARREAEAMVVAGFFEPLFARIPDAAVRDEVRARVAARLGS